MNRKQRLMQTYRQLAEKAVDAHLEYKTTFILSGVILAMEASGCKVKYEKFLNAFAQTYPLVLQRPDEMMKQAEEIAQMSLEIHWEDPEQE